MKQTNWYQKEIDTIYQELSSSIYGLTEDEANERIKKYGKNALPEGKKNNIFNIFIHELLDPIVLLLIVAIIASFFANEVVDAIAIIIIVMVDAIMGTYQENKANHTIESLSKLVTVKTRVFRNQEIMEIDSVDLVVGDIVFLESGDKISADLRMIEAHNLTVNESVLTGESIQVDKSSDVIHQDNLVLAEQANMLFSGTTVITGRGKAIVVATGLSTEIGKIANTIHHTKEEKSPLTIRVQKLSKQISILVLMMAIIIAILFMLKGVSYHEIFLSVVALAVSAMPEGLPLALTMALTIASNKMAKKQVVVKELNSVESLGSCTVIASDKTGTLTVNEQTARKILLPNELEYDVMKLNDDMDLTDVKDLALYGYINNEAILEDNKKIGDSIDIAFKMLGKKLKVDTNSIYVLEEIPYESQNKYSTLFYEQDGKTYCTIKGSFEKVVTFCNKIHLVDHFDFEKLRKQNEKLAQEGYRVIAIANGIISTSSYTENDIQNLTFMGMVGFIDPIREDVIYSLDECRKAGIKVLMITGDHPLTAFSIAKELNLTNDYEQVTTGEEVDFYLGKSQEEFDQFIKSKIIYTRVTPLQKLEIVKSLKRQGEFVAVTGDGVNDSPALKTSNIGIAMGSGTDIALETSKMIIMDDNFKSIVAGIKEGRVAYANIRKIIYFLLSCGFGEVLFFLLAILFDLPMPLVAIQLLWLNVVTDGIQDFFLSFEKAEDNIMSEKPRNTKESLLDKNLLQEVIVSGIVIGGMVFLVWFYLIQILHMDLSLARGYIMAFMVFIQNIHVFNCRSERKSAFSVPFKNNYLIVVGVVISILLQIIVMESSILSRFLQTSKVPFPHLVCLFLLALFILVTMEIYKKIRNGVHDNFKS